MNFQQVFNQIPQVEANAPGRVNLLGEHTDYNDGFVLPTAIPQQTTVSLGFSADNQHHFYSQELAQQVNIASSDPTPEGFASYLFGCVGILQAKGVVIPPLNVFVTSTVPIGAGLSSSAALEVAMLRGLRSLLNLELDDVCIAQVAQQAERQYAGVQCGIMDQMASSLADTQHLLFLDTRSLERKVLPIPAGSEILVIDSGIPRTLAGSGYNQRREECEAAAKLLNVPALRDVTNIEAIANLPILLQQRARHVITENNRVLIAQSGISAQQFGELMNASHASLRDDYDVSVTGLDTLVEILQANSNVFGARMTGAGFGGACVALVAQGQAETIAQQAIAKFNSMGYSGHVLVPVAASLP